MHARTIAPTALALRRWPGPARLLVPALRRRPVRPAAGGRGLCADRPGGQPRAGRVHLDQSPRATTCTGTASACSRWTRRSSSIRCRCRPARSTPTSSSARSRPTASAVTAGADRRRRQRRRRGDLQGEVPGLRRHRRCYPPQTRTLTRRAAASMAPAPPAGRAVARPAGRRSAPAPRRRARRRRRRCPKTRPSGFEAIANYADRTAGAPDARRRATTCIATRPRSASLRARRRASPARRACRRPSPTATSTSATCRSGSTTPRSRCRCSAPTPPRRPSPSKPTSRAARPTASAIRR